MIEWKLALLYGLLAGILFALYRISEQIDALNRANERRFEFMRSQVSSDAEKLAFTIRDQRRNGEG